MSYLDPTYELPGADEAVRLRRIIKMQLAVIVSLLLHFVIVIVVALMPPDERYRLVAKLDPKDETPIPITFMSPLPPAPRAQPTPPPRPSSPQDPRFAQRIPDPKDIVDPKANYRMDPNDKLLPASPKQEKARANGASGRNDRRPEGGLAGGELPRPTPGAPSGATVQDETSEQGVMRDTIPDTPDLAGRLRDFRRAISQPRPASPTGPKGGGSGKGGVEMPAVPQTGFGVGNIEFESRDYDWSDYGKAVYIAIWRAWHNRLLMTVGNFERWAAVRKNSSLEHTSGVRFVITRQGDVEDIVIETDSGCIPLDASAADALREVVLPPLPDDFPRDQERVHARFIATGDVRNMRRSLEWLHSRGYF